MLPTARFASRSPSDVLDYLTAAVRAVEEANDVRALAPFLAGWSDGDRLAWDGFLLRQRDELALVGGSPESRFAERARRMVRKAEVGAS